MIQYPSEIILEVTNACNLRCRYCHFHGEGVLKRRPTGWMNRTVWEKVLDEIRLWPQSLTLVTHGAGEPLLYPQLESLLTEAVHVPSAHTGFMTNGMLLGDEAIRLILDAGVKWLAFSVDGVQPDTHDHFRVNADLNRIEAQIHNLIAEKNRRGKDTPVLYFNMVGYPEILDQSRRYVEKWLPYAEQVTIATFRPAGSRKLWEETASFPFRPCPLLTRQLVIGTTGQVGLCCEDIFLDVPLGNVLENTLEEIFNDSQMLIRYRTAHEQGEIDSLPLCRDCHVWGADHVLNRECFRLEDRVVEETTTPAYHLFRKRPEQDNCSMGE